MPKRILYPIALACFFQDNLTFLVSAASRIISKDFILDGFLPVPVPKTRKPETAKVPLGTL